MQHHLTNQRISEILSKLFNSQVFDRQRDTSALVYDLPYLRERLQSIRRSFPDNAFHTMAIKASPNASLLAHLRDTDFGLEAASAGELEIARQSGYPPSKIVFDSPVKTREELEDALTRNIHINADSLQELERIAAIKNNRPSQSNIGLRINPQVGIGTIAITSVAGNYSKFGVPLEEKYEEIIQAYLAYPWLNSIHLHIGSQGCQPHMLVKGVRKVLDLAGDIHKAFAKHAIKRQISYFDIGGGLPISYHRATSPPTMEYYATMLKEACPELFGPDYPLITEFGRYVFTNAGFAISRVEYVKYHRGVNTAMIHTGANMFIRETYHPQQWKHEISVATPDGRIKTGRAENPWVIAGPLCFAGDILARNINLPPIEEGDYIIVHDSGAYTLSMWSEYNSRQKPQAFGITKRNQIVKLKERDMKG